MSLIDFAQTHFRVLALALPWITLSIDALNNDGELKKFVVHFDLFTMNGDAAATEWAFGHVDSFKSRYVEIASIIAMLVISLLVSIGVYLRGKDILGDVVYTALHFVQWIFDLVVIGLFYGLIQDELEKLGYDVISFGLFALIACLLVSTFHVFRFVGTQTGLFTFSHVGHGKY